jgi:Amt family ammonium transporter
VSRRAFGVHGVGGLIGILLAGVLATASIGGTSGLIEGNPQLIQFYGVAVTLVWSGGVTFLLLKLVRVFVPLRVSRQREMEGLDILQHGQAYSSYTYLNTFILPSPWALLCRQSVMRRF